ncbi:Bbp19 family protein [Marinobacterium jannaschii]|uniref:Bbp19 family protein n=1 Tax=Marinobacterium jannaschii TaxID=64970 RepID=UPI000687D1E9|nr:hypothetical protein [Marinobacterium jannaschii]
MDYQDELSDEQQSDVGKESRQHMQRQLDDLAAVMGTEAGQRLVWRLLESTGIYQQSYTGDPASTYFNEGRRSIGLMIMADIHSDERCSHSYFQLINQKRED